MNVGIDVTSLLYSRGVSRYTANLVRALLSQPSLELSLYGTTLRQKNLLKKLVTEIAPLNRFTQLEIHQIPTQLQDILWNTLGLHPVAAQLPGIEVFHSWDWIQPPDRNVPIVSTIHDLAILRYPDTAHPQIVSMHQKAWKRLRQTKAEIIAVSRSTKKDIVELLDIPAERVHVIYEALPVEMKQVSEALTDEKYKFIQTKLKLTQPYILFVGTREPRKNVARLIQAWAPLANELQLIIAGEQGWDETSSPALRKSLTNPKLRFLGRVSDVELAVLYGEATLFAYPCLYEGFGLPILEAFYHGAPVLTSNVSAMVEVAGNAAELVDPFAIDSINQGIINILNENMTQQQRRMQQMIIRLQMFDWNRVVKSTLAVYQQAINRSKE